MLSYKIIMKFRLPLIACGLAVRSCSRGAQVNLRAETALSVDQVIPKGHCAGVKE